MQGKAGEAPSASELAAALSSRSAFVYLGHGGGDQYLPPSRLRALDRCASSLLMGCSSGRLRCAAAAAGHYDPSGPVLAYLLAGEGREGSLQACGVQGSSATSAPAWHVCTSCWLTHQPHFCPP